jgi:hypothetical protein
LRADSLAAQDTSQTNRHAASQAYHNWVRADTTFYPRIHVFANGALKGVVGQSSDATSTTGSLGVAYEGTRFLVTGSVTLAAKVDTVRSSFGGTLLTTGSGSSLNAGLLDIRFWHFLKGSRPEDCFSDHGVDDWECNIGFRVNASASSSFWRDTIAADSGRPAISVVTWALYGGVFYAFSAGKVLGKDVSVILNAGLVQRSIRGDLLEPRNAAAHQAYLQTTHSDFYGLPSIALEIGYTDLHASMEYVKMNGAVDGFSRGQVVAAIQIQTDLITGIVRGSRP